MFGQNGSGHNGKDGVIDQMSGLPDREMTVSELDKEVRNSRSMLANLDFKKLDKTIFDEWSTIRDEQLKNMKESFDKNFDDMQKYVDKYLKKL